jgi:hypothetical protein
MNPQPDPHHEIDGDVYVSPRHLASTTGTGDPALAPLLDLGWDLRYDEDSNVYVSAPDRRVRLGYLPEGEDDGLWRINAYEDSFGPPAWGVCFNDRVPTEFFSELTRASRDQVTGRSVLRGRAGMGPENGCERRGC